jgi:lysophospholipase L1-like esterase
VTEAHDPPRTSWRVSVLGNSLPILMVPPRRDRSTEATYPEHLERRLRAGGLDVTVRNDSRLFGLLTDGYRHYQLDVVPWAPDVLVVHFGIIELQPNVVPTFLNRHFTTQHTGGKGLVGLYRRRVMGRLWPPLRRYQRRAATVVGPDRSFRLPPAHFEAELRRLIQQARSQQVLVLVCDINPPGARLEHFLPGIRERWRRYQAILEQVVADAADDDVRLVRVSKVVEGHEDEALPDGLHFTATGHADVARLLSDEVEPWLRALRDGPPA